MTRDSWTPNQGQIIGERYKLRHEIGRGGMGVVYEGLDVMLERPVALKFLDPDYITDAEALDRFQREALTAGRIGHENICDVRDLGTTDEGVPFIVMELLEGRPLSHYASTERPLDFVEAIDIMLEALAGLEAAHHAGVIHRDLKPENIFLVEGLMGRSKVKLVDFGISKFTGEGSELRLTKTGVVMGSPFYMSPEQARGYQDMDSRSDLWGVGVILYELVTEELPFSGENYNEVMVNIVTEPVPRVREKNPAVPRKLASVIEGLLTKDKKKRYQTAGEVAAALLEARKHCPGANDIPVPQARPVGTMLVRRSSPLSRKYLIAATIVGVIVFGAFSGYLLSGVWLEYSSSSAGVRRETAGENPTPITPATLSSRSEPQVGVPTPITATVTLVDIPEGATLSFESEPVNGDSIQGLVGQTGVLEVLLSGGNTVLIPIRLEDGLQFNVSARIPVAKAEQTPLLEGNSVADDQHDGTVRSLRSPRSTRDAKRDTIDSSSASSGRFIKGRGGAKVKTTYGDF